MNLKSLAVFAGFFALSACAAMQQSFIQNTCNREGAFQKGYNDGQSGTEMNSYFAQQCPPETQELVKQSYQNGYMNAKAQQPTQININTGGGGGGGTWMCKDSYGKQVCGYHCLEAYGKVKCARVSHHHCIESFGEIHCGLRCREEYGKVVCDEYE